MKRDRRPPANITTEAFFTQWLPAEIQRLGSAKGAPPLVVRVVIRGRGGSQWDLHLVQGRLDVTRSDGVASVSTGENLGSAAQTRCSAQASRPVAGQDPAAGRPFLTMALSEADWRAVMVGEDGVQLIPPGASPLDLLFVDGASQRLVGQLEGAFLFQILGFNGRTWQLEAFFGRGPVKETPDAILTTDAATYSAILARKLTPPEAFFAGKVTLTGDRARGMQVGLALLPKF